MKNNDNSTAQDRATIYDIARITGTTISAVSRAFNPDGKIAADKRKLILDTAALHGYKPNRSAAALSRKRIKIGFAALANIPEYYGELIAGVSSAHKRLADYRVECAVKLIPTADCNDANCVAIINELRAEGCDGLLLSLLDYGPATRAKIAELADAGVPAATITSDEPDSRRLFTSQNNLDSAGRIAAQLLSLFMRSVKPNSGMRAVIFSGVTDSYIHSRLLAGFADEAKAYGVKLAEIYDTRDIPEIAAKQADDLIAKYFSGSEPGIDGIYFSSANSLPVISRLNAAGFGGKLGIVTSDVFPELAAYIRDGTVGATIYQNPFEQARLAFDTMYYYLTEHRLKQTMFRVTPQAVMKSNLNLYIE
jgi:Transcriptional regulators